MTALRLGSLFDGIGVFPLAAVRCGIEPIWASEIEKAPISITKRHFPDMAHLGDVTKLDGRDLPPVHIITFGSPCQNLSQIGNRKGLAGEKSSLFFQAIRIIKAMIGHSAKVAENATLRKQRELDALTARDRELDMLFERLYEDNVAGKIDDARFAKMSKRYEQEQGENAKKIKALRLELKKDESKRMDIDDFLETVRRYTDATTITKRMVAELIDHIEVYHAEKQDGVTNQRVDIHYNCIGAFDVPDRRKIPEADIIMETRKGVALSYAPEQVAV